MVAARRSGMTLEQYLDYERGSAEKHEFLDGDVWPLRQDAVAMAGARPKHNLIAVATSSSMYMQLRARGCRVYNSDQKVRTPSGLVTYPDISVTCAPPAYDERHGEILLNPALIVEILSPSSERYDRGQKFMHYRTIPTLQAYLLIAQDTYSVEMYLRHDAEWHFSVALGREGVLAWEAWDLHMPLAEVYASVEMDDADR